MLEYVHLYAICNISTIFRPMYIRNWISFEVTFKFKRFIFHNRNILNCFANNTWRNFKRTCSSQKSILKCDTSCNLYFNFAKIIIQTFTDNCNVKFSRCLTGWISCYARIRILSFLLDIYHYQSSFIQRHLPICITRLKK